MGFLARLAWRRLRRHAGLMLAAALCLGIACLAIATAQVHATAAGEAARAHALASEDRRIVVRGPLRDGVDEPDRAVSGIAAGIPGATVQRWTTSATYGLAGGDSRVRLEFAPAPASVEMVGGEAPTSPEEVAIPEDAAAYLRLRVGSTIQATPLLPAQSDVPALRLTGIYRADPDDPTWREVMHDGGVRADDFVTLGPLLLATPEHPAFAHGAAGIWWIQTPAHDRDLGAPVDGALAALRTDPALRGFTVRTRLPELLVAAAEQERRTAAAVTGPAVLLGVVAGVSVALVGLLLGSAHRRTDQLLLSRGASPGQLATVVLLGSLVLAPVVVAAALLAPTVAGVLPGGSAVAAVVSPWTWALASLTAVLGALVLTTTTLVGVAGEGSAGHAGAVLALAAPVAAVSWWRLHSSPAPSPIATLVLALALLAAGALAVVLLLAGTRVGSRMLSSGRTMSWPVTWGTWSLRRPGLPVTTMRLLTVLTMALVTLALTQVATLEAIATGRGVTAAPAATTVEVAPVARDRVADLGARLPAAATPVWTGEFSLPSGVAGALVAVEDPGVPSAPWDGHGPDPDWPDAAAALTAGASGVEAPAVLTRSLATLTGVAVGDVTRVTVGSAVVPIRVVGITHRVPGQGTAADGVVTTLTSLRAAIPGRAFSPQQIWTQALPEAVAALGEEHLRVSTQHQAIEQARDEPAPAALRGALLLVLGGSLTCAVLGALACATGARRGRTRDHGVLSALGASPAAVQRGAGGAELVQTLLAVGLGLLVGVVLAAAVGDAWSTGVAATVSGSDPPTLPVLPVLPVLDLTIAVAAVTLLVWAASVPGLRASAESPATLLREGAS